MWGNVKMFCEVEDGTMRRGILVLAASVFDDPDLLLRQPIQLIHQLINLLIGRIYLPLQQFPLALGLGLRAPPMQLQHPVYEFDYLWLLTSRL